MMKKMCDLYEDEGFAFMSMCALEVAIKKNGELVLLLLIDEQKYHNCQFKTDGMRLFNQPPLSSCNYVPLLGAKCRSCVTFSSCNAARIHRPLRNPNRILFSSTRTAKRLQRATYWPALCSSRRRPPARTAVPPRFPCCCWRKARTVATRPPLMSCQREPAGRVGKARHEIAFWKINK